MKTPRGLEAVMKLKEMAEADENYTQRCIYGEKVFFQQEEGPLVEGHIYSPEGMKEFRISRCCEFHFDRLFKDDEE